MDTVSNAIIVDGLSKKFGKFIAVDNISFYVKKGEIFAFLGPNGAGKSTTIKMLTTLLNPTSGKMELNGFDPLTEKDKTRKSFGIVFQDPSLDDELTAFENLEYHGILYNVESGLRHKRIKELMMLVGLWDKKDNQVKTFSGGMKRRLEIARGLSHHPDIFFLDEPTLGLDPQTRNQIWDYIKELNKDEGITIFFTTHYMEEAEKVADRIAVIDHGKIITQGTVRELQENTKTNSLEEAFLKLTGKEIREEEATNMDHMRSMRNMWTNRKRI
jgi:ABC-2 type transport system ATP-binding protein